MNVFFEVLSETTSIRKRNQAWDAPKPWDAVCRYRSSHSFGRHYEVEAEKCSPWAWCPRISAPTRSISFLRCHGIGHVHADGDSKLLHFVHELPAGDLATKFDDFRDAISFHVARVFELNKVFASGQAIREARLTVLRPTVHGSKTSRTQKRSLCGFAASGGVLNPQGNKPQIGNKQPENAAFEIGPPGNDESGLHRLP